MEGSKAIRVYLLCSPYVERGANTLNLKYQKSRILLAWLTLHAGQRYSRDWLAEWLWPEDEATAGRRKLKRSLFELREIFAEALESGRDHVCLHAAGSLWVDALAFTERLASVRVDTQGAARTDSLQLLEWLEATAELYRGSFLEGVQTTCDEACDRWVQDCRERYRQATLQLCQRLAAGFAAHGDQQRALSYSRRLTREEPWNERAWQQLIGLLVGYGHHREAQNVLAQCRSALASELDAEPSAETLALLNAPALAAAPEQRGMTVLCCRLQGPDSSEPDDALALQEPIGQCLRLLGEAGARVYRTASDDLLAFFGYPQAMENAALRAVGAALDCLATVGAPASAACALHSGLALSLPDGDAPDVGGRLSRLALRLADSALPGQLLASQATVEQLPGGQFEMRALAPLLPPGSGQALPVWLIDARRGPLLQRKNAAPVGRDGILQALQALWQQARYGAGLSVLVSGEAGIGKSTVLQFFARQHAIAGVDLVCRMESAATPLHPFLHWLQRLPTPQDAAGREALAGLHELLETTRTTPALAPDICTQLLSLLRSQVPPGGIICIDDAHWADPSTCELLGLLIQQPLPGRLLLIATRETLNPAWEAPGKAEHLHLLALSEDASSTLVSRLSGPEGLPATTVLQVARACAGVPLFIEEMTRCLLTSGNAAQAPLTLPLSLQDLLMAHIDSLAQAKPLAQLAAAFDGDFSPALLAEAAELEPRRLEPLLHTLRQQRLFVPGTEAELAFRHVLLREAAYQSMPRSRRQWAHERILASLLRLQPALASEEPSRLAWHSERAGQLAAARGYLLAAGRLAVLRSAYHEALEHYWHALTLLDDGADTQEELQLRMAMGTPLAILHGNGAQSCRDNFNRALQLAEPLGDDPRLFPAYWGLWLGSSSWQGFLQSEPIARRLIRLAQQAGDNELLGHGYYALGNSLFTMGRFHEAQACLERACELPLQPPSTALRLGEDARANSLSFLALALWFCGRGEQARTVSEQAVQRARRLDSAYMLCQTLSLAALFGQTSGNTDYTEQCAQEGLEIARQHDIALWSMACTHLLGWTQAARGQGDAIVSMLESCAAVGQVMGGSVIFFLAIITDAAWHAGLRDIGLEAIERGLEAARQYAADYPLAELLRLKGEWLCSDGETRSSGIEYLEQALATARRQDSPPLILRTARSLLARRPDDAALVGLLADTGARLHTTRQHEPAG